jgi:RecB family exonuclease
MFDETIKMGLAQKYPIPYFSYSQLNTYLSCPHTYRLTYLSGNFERRGNKYTELGSILHDIFERQGKSLIFESTEKYTLGKAKKDFNKTYMALKEDERTKAYFDDKEDFIKLYNKGIKALENYFEMYSEATPLYVERQFKKPIAEGLPPAKSFIDRIDGDKDDPSSWVVTDYKTGGSPKSKQYLNNDFQLALYASQIFAEFGAYPQAVQFVHPVPAKTQTAVHQGNGVYKFSNQRKPVVEFSVADTIIKITDTLAQIVKAIEEDNFPLVTDSWNCKMCFFYQDGTCKPFDEAQQGWANI